MNPVPVEETDTRQKHPHGSDLEISHAKSTFCTTTAEQTVDPKQDISGSDEVCLGVPATQVHTLTMY